MVSTHLDSDELLHLAIHASKQNDAEKAIELLKQLLEKDSEHPRGLYFLGAMYAEIGLYDRAKEFMSKAIDNDINLPTADFQLGLLYATSGQVSEAKNAWLPLHSLPENDPLYLFQRGITHLLEDRFDACKEDLQNGIDANQINDQLNHDMQMIIDEVNARNLSEQNPLNNNQIETAEESVSENTATSADESGKKVLLTAYQRQNFDDE